MNRKNLFCLFALMTIATLSVQAQPGPFSVEIKKDKPFEERKLKAEKTGDGPIKAPKRIFTNLTTRFNYVFNANVKFNEILERAKAQHKDDYSQLLTFYPFTLEATAADSAQLDSLIFKCRTGIVNHDLRGEWTDELYLLWAQSWHLQKKLDSASLMLQFINYAYAPQQEYGYYDYIGSRKDGASELSIATPEKKKLLHSNTFSRNNSFVWQIRTLVEMGEFGSSGSLITTLKRDPVFPKRLGEELAEAEAYWYYRQGRWDSAAAYLIKALGAAGNGREKARWEYLIAQLLERSGNNAGAATYFASAIGHTPDPVMEVYGRLNLVRINKEGGEKAIDKNVAELLKMAKKDKYEDYRDIIYYMAAQMEMERANIAGAQELLMKGARFNNGNGASRNKAFLQIADVSFDQKKYLQAASFYDSVQVNDLAEADAQRVFGRKPALQVIATNSGVVQRQDSLQRIAAMPKEQQEDYIKKLLKQLRKAQGLKEEAAPTGGSSAASAPPADLFATGSKGDWYFYNTSAKTQGEAEFKRVWGNRPNVDNWRRFAVVNQQLVSRNITTTDPKGAGVNAGADELTVEALFAALPTAPEALKASNDSIRDALFNIGAAYLNDLEDYPSAIATYEEIRRRFPAADRMDEVLFNLYYAHNKAGRASEAAAFKRMLLEKYPQSRYAAILTTGKDPQSKTAALTESTKAYEGVYTKFIEGNFAEAIAAKRQADSAYKTTVWQPQLLYIQAVYFIKQREDSQAKASLQTIIRQNDNAALAAKAQNLLSVLNRRQQIEDELNRYQMQGADSAATARIDTAATKTPSSAVTPAPKKDSATVKTPLPKPIDSTAIKANAAKNARDSLSRMAAAAKEAIANAKADSLAKRAADAKAAKDSIAKAKGEALAKKEAQAKATKDSIAAARADALARKAAEAKAKADSVAKAKADDLAKRAAAKTYKDSVAQAARDSIAKRTDAAKFARDSTARAKADSVAKWAAAAKAAKEAAAKAKADSLAKKAAAAKASKEATARAKADSLAKRAATAKAARDSAAQAQKDLLVKKAAEAKAARDSLANARAAAKAAKDSTAKALAAAAKAAKDSMAKRTAEAKAVKDSMDKVLAAQKAARDSLARIAALPKSLYTFTPETPHYAMVVLDKVDPVFVNEARNSFFQFNRERFNGQPLDVQLVPLTADIRIVLVSGFATAQAATDYVQRAKPLAKSEIIPWLPAAKYSFGIISAPNLEVLKGNTDVGGYRKFLEQYLPGKF